MIYLTGIVLQSGKSPISDRIYPRSEVEKAVAEFNATYLDAGKECLCQLVSSSGGPIVSIDDISHTISECRVDEDGSVVATIKTIDTERGRLLESLIENDMQSSLQLYPVLTGTADGDNVVTELSLIRIDIQLNDK